MDTFASSLDALADWRRALDRRIVELARYLGEHELLEGAAVDAAESMRQRLAADKLVVAFVAEFSRGKSELINAIFFADTGRRILPATPGRTTMCPVELAYDAHEMPALALLPIDTRLQGLSLAELRERPESWTHVRLDPASPDKLAEALTEVMRTKAVSTREARDLGFWSDDRPDDNPPLIAEGLVEVPAWRHALINYPHPLLRRGLVVLDTPGLNAIGAEPELTLSLLPSAHAAVFVLGADTGVTKSDMTIWRDHLSSQAMARYVVLNKIDALADPLASDEEVAQQIEQQCAQTAATLDLPPERVFPLSARAALAARVDGHRGRLVASRLPALEHALSVQLLPQRRQVLEQMVLEGLEAIEAHIGRAIGDRRRQVAEQMLELRGVRGKSGSKVQLMLQRVDRETEEFETCIGRLAAVRSVHSRMLRDVLVLLQSERLRDEVTTMQREIAVSLFNLGAKKSFTSLCARLREMLIRARGRSDEIHQMLGATFRQLNTEFGFALTLSRAPTLERHVRELDLIERNYVQYLGLSHALRLSEPRFIEQFRRMLLSKLRVVFENATGEIELWNKGASSQVDSQLRERRRGFKRRREALERIQLASGELEARIAELESQDERAQQLQARVAALAGLVRAEAQRTPELGGHGDAPALTLVTRPPQAQVA
jgi:hypothetical protein